MARTVSGALYSWGRPENGTGYNYTNLYPAVVATSATSPLVVTQAFVRGAAGGYALSPNGIVYSWGDAANGGNGHALNRSWAAPVQGLPTGYLPGASAVPPVSEVRSGTLVERGYALPDIPVGKTLTVVVHGKVNQGVTDFNVLNQAWFTSPSTPYAGLHGQAKPNAPQDPGTGAAFNANGIVGNPTCDTDASTPVQNVTTPDSCDQVPTRIAARSGGATNAPGSLSGTVWVDDASLDGVRDAASPGVAGVPLSLYNSAGTLMGQTLTAADGGYLFSNVPVGSGYRVEFGVRGHTPTQPILDALGLVGSPSDYAYGFTTAGASCLADRSCAVASSARSAAVNVVAGAETRNVNAGVVLAAASLQVTKSAVDPAVGNPAQLTADVAGNSAAVPMVFTFTNKGSEPLASFSWVDTTLAGPAVTGLACTLGGAPVSAATLVLAVGATVECAATLPAMSIGDSHRDRFTVNAVGATTGTFVSGEALWEAVVGATPSWTLSKAADPTSGQTVAAGSRVTYTLTATNTGNFTLDDLTVTDEVGALLEHASLSDPLPVGLTRTGTGAHTVLEWRVPKLAAGGAISVSYTVVVNANAHGATLVNTAHGAGTVQDPTDATAPRVSLDPAACTAAVPCETMHRVAILPIVVPLPENPPLLLAKLGSDGVLFIGMGGTLLLAGGLTILLIQRRNRSLMSAPARGDGSSRE